MFLFLLPYLPTLSFVVYECVELNLDFLMLNHYLYTLPTLSWLQLSLKALNYYDNDN